MNELIVNSACFGVVLSVGAFLLGRALQKRIKHPLCNPLLIAIVLVILFLLVFDLDYESYQRSARYLSYFLTPATVCLAIPLYEQFELLKKNLRAVLAGIGSGVLASLCSVLVLSLLFRLDHASYVTFLPKSITTAIGMGVSEELGGYVSITVAVIILTGILGNMFAETACRLFRITEPIARGVAIGSASHALGTAKAMELGPVEGAMSSLSIVVSGLLTVAGAVVFANFL
ncbi:MAG: LrgB family protein [Clostridiales bacterium]|nr:LrgB family protein [Clostridiales bacterium]